MPSDFAPPRKGIELLQKTVHKLLLKNSRRSGGKAIGDHLVCEFEAFLQSEAAEHPNDSVLNRLLFTVSEMARATGCNRKTIAD